MIRTTATRTALAVIAIALTGASGIAAAAPAGPSGPGPNGGGVVDPGPHQSGLYENGTGSQVCQVWTDAANDAIRAGNRTRADDIAGAANRKGCTIIEITS